MSVVCHRTEFVIHSIETGDVARRPYSEVDKAWRIVWIWKDQQEGIVGPVLKLSWIAIRSGFDCETTSVLDHGEDAISIAEVVACISTDIFT